MATENQAEVIEELRARLKRLESAERRPRGSCNMTQAAEYLGRSQEWLYQEHLAGRGPPRKRIGSRNWSYSFSDLDKWVAEQKGDV